MCRPQMYACIGNNMWNIGEIVQIFNRIWSNLARFGVYNMAAMLEFKMAAMWDDWTYVQLISMYIQHGFRHQIHAYIGNNR